MLSKAKIPQAVLDEAKEVLEKRLIRTLKDVGEECVAEAIESGNYNDRTGNLRSSIGYVVAKDGSVVEEGGFYNIGFGEGASVGRGKAEEAALGTSGITLILIAGMDYAQYVADKGYNVIDSAELLAKQLISQLSSR